MIWAIPLARYDVVSLTPSSTPLLRVVDLQHYRRPLFSGQATRDACACPWLFVEISYTSRGFDRKAYIARHTKACDSFCVCVWCAFLLWRLLVFVLNANNRAAETHRRWCQLQNNFCDVFFWSGTGGFPAQVVEQHRRSEFTFVLPLRGEFRWY